MTVGVRCARRLDAENEVHVEGTAPRCLPAGTDSASSILVSVYADDILIRTGLETLLIQEPLFRVVNPSAGDSTTPRPDVAVVLLDSAVEDELPLLRRLAAEVERRVVLTASCLDDSALEKVTDAGVHSIVWREELSADRLAACVRIVAQGGGDIPADLVPRLADQARSARRRAGAAHSEVAALTDRETEVLRLLSQGWDTREVAEKMAYSERTVKGLLHNLMGRRRFRNRTHAVAVALREGYI